LGLSLFLLSILHMYLGLDEGYKAIEGEKLRLVFLNCGKVLK